MLVVFEGMDGTGKSTLLDHVHSRLIDRGIQCTKTRRPYAIDVRNLVYTDRISNSKFHILIADALQQIYDLREEIQSTEHVVLCDRWVHSQFVYQTHEKVCDTLNDGIITKDIVSRVAKLVGYDENFLETLFSLPDVVVECVADIETIRSRILSRPDEITPFDRKLIDATEFEGSIRKAYSMIFDSVYIKQLIKVGCGDRLEHTAGRILYRIFAHRDKVNCTSAQIQFIKQFAF